MQPGTAGQNITQAVQDSFDRGLIGESAGRIQQSSISIFGAPHDLGALLPRLWYAGRIIRSTLHETHSHSYFSSCSQYRTQADRQKSCYVSPVTSTDLVRESPTKQTRQSEDPRGGSIPGL